MEVPYSGCSMAAKMDYHQLLLGKAGVMQKMWSELH
jgi:hypothetical protein